MKSSMINTITSNEDDVRFRIFSGDLQISDAGSELLRIERASHEAERWSHARTRQILDELRTATITVACKNPKKDCELVVRHGNSTFHGCSGQDVKWTETD